MFKFFSSIFIAIEMVFNFLLSTVKGLVEVIVNVVAASAYLIQCISFLPAPLIAAASCVVGVSVIYMIVGRDG